MMLLLLSTPFSNPGHLGRISALNWISYNLNGILAILLTSNLLDDLVFVGFLNDRFHQEEGP